jgi:hypothetical protein
MWRFLLNSLRIILIFLAGILSISIVIVGGSLLTVDCIQNFLPQYAEANGSSLFSSCLTIWSVAVTALLIIGGWLWTSSENRKSVQKNKRLDYLVRGLFAYTWQNGKTP